VSPIKITFQKLRDIDFPSCSRYVKEVSPSDLPQLNKEVLTILDQLARLKSKIIKARQNPATERHRRKAFQFQIKFIVCLASTTPEGTC